MSDDSNTIAPYAPVLIKLLQGILYQDDTARWNLLLNHIVPVRAYFAKIGLLVDIDEAEGYAYLRQPGSDDDEDAGALPRLVRRVPLSYPVTLLCVLLREELLQFDSSGSSSDRLVLSRDVLRGMLRPFFGERDEKRFFRKIDAVINRVADIGFLKELHTAEGDYYEVRRILKAKIPADILAEIKQRLEAHASTQHDDGS